MPPTGSLRPVIVWAVRINAIGAGLTVLAVIALRVYLHGVAEAMTEGREPPMTSQDVPSAILVLVLVFLATLLVGTVLTVGALLLLRLGAGFRGQTPFAQALQSAVLAFVVSVTVSVVVFAVSQA